MFCAGEDMPLSVSSLVCSRLNAIVCWRVGTQATSAAECREEGVAGLKCSYAVCG
jgi:hypothetical protein